jgi:hypothetical protein
MNSLPPKNRSLFEKNVDGDVKGPISLRGKLLLCFMILPCKKSFLIIYLTDVIGRVIANTANFELYEDYGEFQSVENELRDLQTSIEECDAPLPSLVNGGPDIEAWQKIINSIPESNRTWKESPSFISEFYFYRKIADIFSHFSTGRDPYDMEKMAGLLASYPLIESLCMVWINVSTANSDARQLLYLALHSSLWATEQEETLWQLQSNYASTSPHKPSQLDPPSPLKVQRCSSDNIIRVSGPVKPVSEYEFESLAAYIGLHNMPPPTPRDLPPHLSQRQQGQGDGQGDGVGLSAGSGADGKRHHLHIDTTDLETGLDDNSSHQLATSLSASSSAGTGLARGVDVVSVPYNPNPTRSVLTQVETYMRKARDFALSDDSRAAIEYLLEIRQADIRAQAISAVHLSAGKPMTAPVDVMRRMRPMTNVSGGGISGVTVTASGSVSGTPSIRPTRNASGNVERPNTAAAATMRPTRNASGNNERPNTAAATPSFGLSSKDKGFKPTPKAAAPQRRFTFTTALQHQSSGLGGPKTANNRRFSIGPGSGGNLLRNIGIITNSAGFELVCDLLLGHALILADVTDTVTYHTKAYPSFVYGATCEDIRRVINQLYESEGSSTFQVACLLKEHVDMGRFILKDHLFWSMPIGLSDLPPDLCRDLDGNLLTILKGDMNYARLLDDRQWPVTMSLQGVIDQHISALHPACTHIASHSAVLALSRVKSEAVCGVSSAKLDKARGQDRHTEGRSEPLHSSYTKDGVVRGAGALLEENEGRSRSRSRGRIGGEGSPEEESKEGNNSHTSTTATATVNMSGSVGESVDSKWQLSGKWAVVQLVTQVKEEEEDDRIHLSRRGNTEKLDTLNLYKMIQQTTLNELEHARYLHIASRVSIHPNMCK